MRNGNARISLAALAIFAFSASAEAAVIIKTVRVAICVTDTKHPDACKTVPADGHVVVSEDAMEGLEGELGQGATVMEAAGNRATPSGAHEHGRRHQSEPQQ